jgi:hypothetical protein
MVLPNYEYNPLRTARHDTFSTADSFLIIIIIITIQVKVKE